MPKIDDFVCNACGKTEEQMVMPDEVLVCSECGSNDLEKRVGGGHIFSVITPMHKTSLRSKAGYVHNYVNRPAEKTYVTVPK